VTCRERLPFRPPLFPDNLFGHLVATAVPGVEEWRNGAYRRSVRLPHGPAIIALSPPSRTRVSPPTVREPPACDGELLLADERDRGPAVDLTRFLLDLDADPVAIDAALGADPALAPLVGAAPGRRVPRTADGPEFALRAMLGQQVSTAAARTHAARLVIAHGEAIHDPGGGLTHLFPTPAALADLDPATLAVPGARRAAFTGLVAALASGAVTIERDGDPAALRAGLLALPGIGPWTAESVAMRALGDPDAFIPTDLGVKLAADALGLPTTPAALTGWAKRWRPYRAYAVQHLWATGTHPVNHLPR
jgi:AraC family transcriptional regulator, regulatory protein of adaptative response / DNA-3-methyladenine glycosylase II